MLRGAGPAVTLSLLKPIQALQLIEEVRQKALRKVRVEIPTGATLELCGGGFNNRTLAVRVGGYLCFVFIKDIEPRQPLAADVLPPQAA